MKNFFLLPLLLLTFSFTACTFYSTPVKTVKAFFHNLKKGDFENTHKFLNNPMFENVPDVEKELLGIYFETMKIANIKVTEKTDSTAIISLDITAVDIFQNPLLTMYN